MSDHNGIGTALVGAVDFGSAAYKYENSEDLVYEKLVFDNGLLADLEEEEQPGSASGYRKSVADLELQSNNLLSPSHGKEKTDKTELETQNSAPLSEYPLSSEVYLAEGLEKNSALDKLASPLLDSEVNELLSTKLKDAQDLSECEKEEDSIGYNAEDARSESRLLSVDKEMKIENSFQKTPCREQYPGGERPAGIHGPSRSPISNRQKKQYSLPEKSDLKERHSYDQSRSSGNQISTSQRGSLDGSKHLDDYLLKQVEDIRDLGSNDSPVMDGRQETSVSRSPVLRDSQSPVRSDARSPPSQRESQSPVRRRQSRTPVRQREPRSPDRQRESQSPVRQRESRSPFRQRESRSPVRQRESRLPVRQRESQSPVKQRDSQSPVRQRESRSPGQKEAQTPVRQRDSQSPVRHREARSPVRARESRSPVRQREARSPVRAREARSPVRQREARSPVRHREARSPVRLREARSPVRARESRSPVRGRRSRSPVRGRRSRSPAKRRKLDSPVRGRKSLSPVRGGNPRSPVKHRNARSPARLRDSSSGYRSKYRHRSRSPDARDRHRRSPRRYSPRHRSPVGYHSYRRSPKKWSPPPNRSTGLGKPGKNLFVAGFPFLTKERDLEWKFSKFGRVRDVRIVRDKRSGDSRGFGFLCMQNDEEADEAIRALDQTEWNGRIILVEKSKS